MLSQLASISMAQKYDKAVMYANKVLGEQPADILRNWAEWTA